MSEASDSEVCKKIQIRSSKREELVVYVPFLMWCCLVSCLVCSMWKIVSQLMKAKENDGLLLNFGADMPLSTPQVFLVQQKERHGCN